MKADISQSKLDFLDGISNYFWNQTEANGRLICSKHKVEHTGKNCYSIFIDAKLFSITENDKYFQRARSRALRTMANLCRDPDFQYWIFYPGRIDGRNMSNNVIDGGACVDSLVHFLDVFESKIEVEESGKIRDAIFKHCNTYLKTASVQKEITNQRLWGATGLVSGYSIFHENSWEKALIDSIDCSFGEQKNDGSFFYHPNYQEYGIYRGIYDVTAYYHSRHIAFAFHVLEKLNLVKEYIDELIKGLDFLIGMYQPNGVKNLYLETKRWYWESEYEVASHAFDIYALIKGFEHTHKEVYEVYARKAFKKILEHQLPDGGITSHHGRRNNFQCRVFWNGHLAWLIKVIEKLQVDDEKLSLNGSTFYKMFADAQVIKFENADICAILRGRKAPMNIDWGCAGGGGSLLYFGSKRNGWKNELTIKRWTPFIENNFIFFVNIKEEMLNLMISAKGFLKVNRHDIRGRIYRAKLELMRGRILYSFYYILKHTLFKFLSELRGIYTTHWATECEVIVRGKMCKFVLHPSRRNGDLILNDVLVERVYTFDGEELVVEENIDCQTQGNIRLIEYKLIPISNGVSIETNCRLKRSGELLIFKPIKNIPPKILIKYNLG